MNLGVCVRCGKAVEEGNSRCPDCRTARADIVVYAEPGAIHLTGHAAGMIVSKHDADTDDATLSVNDAAGTRSESHADAGAFSLSVSAADQIGRPGEARLVKVLRQRLFRDGLQVHFADGADHRGEDRILHFGDRQFVVQITTIPSRSNFWRDARLATGAMQGSASDAAKWIREAVAGKASRMSPSEIGGTVLAVDVNHAGVLATSTVRTRYLTTYGPPNQEFGFASVWIVGPTLDFCERLGAGVP